MKRYWPRALWLGTLLALVSAPGWATLTQGKFTNNTVPIVMKDSAYVGGHYPIVMAMNLDGTAIGGAGGGGAVTIADAADVALGATTDAASTAGGTGTVNAHTRLMTTQLGTHTTLLAGGLPAALASGGGLKVDLTGTGANTTALKVDGTGGTFPISGTVTANLQPVTSGGSVIYRNLDQGTTGTSPTTTTSQLYGYIVANRSTSERFLKIYNKASAATSSDTPSITIPLPASSLANVSYPNGIAFSLGISLRATTGIADNDTGAPTTNDVVVTILTK